MDTAFRPTTLGPLPWHRAFVTVLLCAGAGAATMGWERLIVSFASPGPRGMGARALITLWAGHTLALLVALSLLAGARLLWSVARRRYSQPVAAWFPGLLLGGVATVPYYLVGQVAAAGAWISEQTYAAYIPAAAAGTGLVATTLVVTAVYGFSVFRRRSGLAATSVTCALGVAGLALGFVDLTVFPSLHAEFHLFAFGLHVMLIAAAVARLGLRASRPTRALTPRVLPLAAGVTVVAGAVVWLGMTGSVRSELVLRSPSGANWIRALGTGATARHHLRRALAAIDASALGTDGVAGGDNTTREGFAADPAWNILFVTVDTLRADALPPARRPDATYLKGGETPVLDALIARSYRFDRAYTQASATHRSMPPMFRSLEAYENPERFGVSLGASMADLGHVTLAVVNNFFIEPRYRRIQQLLDGFQRVAVYKKKRMNDQQALVEELLDSTRGQPFFAWVHYYCLHMPGYADRQLQRKDGSWRARYRRSLMWLDGQMGDLIGYLETAGLAEHTIIVFTADHGEGLGDNRVHTHGPTVFEEEVRTPLFIHIPGKRGASIAATVGNIDIVPTLLELLGAPAEPSHRGRSLVPLMADPSRPWPHDYYVENRDRKRIALVRGRDKLIWDREADLFLRFDLELDPAEDSSLYGHGDALDSELLTGLVRKNPGLFKEELDSEPTQRLLDKKWAELAEARPRTSAKKI